MPARSRGKPRNVEKSLWTPEVSPAKLAAGEIEFSRNAVARQPILAVLMALRATKGDENPQRPDGIRPQDAILPHKLCRRPVVFDRVGGLLA